VEESCDRYFSSLLTSSSIQTLHIISFHFILLLEVQQLVGILFACHWCFLFSHKAEQPNNMSSNERNGRANPRLLLSLLALVGVAAVFILGEFQILSPFSRFLSDSAGSMDKAALSFMPGTVIHSVTKDAKPVKPVDTNNDKPKKPTIKRIVLIGERHSGTSYTTRKLAECFPDLQVTDSFVRYKHWFQPTPEYIVNVTKTLLKDDTQKAQMKSIEIPENWPDIASMKNPENAFQDTLLVVMFRNAYDWLDAMREGPHHWPNHLGLARFPDGPHEDRNGNGRNHEYGVLIFQWTDFIKANMTLSRNNGDTTTLCQHGFLYGTISPCFRSKELYPDVVRKDYAPDMSAAPDYLNYNADKPVYELDQDGKPYANPLAFRTAKMQNFLDIPKHWNLGGFLTLRHEQENEIGSEYVLKQVSELVGMDAKCQADPPKRQEHKHMDRQWEQWITDHADWETEGVVGYVPRDAAEKKPQADAVPKVVENKVEVIPQAQASSNVKSFDRIVLLGERHSGTTYTTRMLERCFPDIEVSDFFVRFKHWFQPTPDYVANTTKQYLKNDMTDDEGEDMFEIHNQWPNIAALEDPKTAFKNTLLIVMFRNPYDWLEAMRVGPHHWTNHFSLYRFPRAPVPETTGNPWYGSNFTTWAEFVAAKMTLDMDDGSEGTQLCQNGYLKGQVTPCLKSKKIYPPEVKRDYPNDVNEAPDSLPFNAHFPIYELDPDGKPYADPLAFRAAKIQNFLDIPNHWDLGSFMTLQHEEVNEKGSGFLLEQVSRILGQEPICQADPPKNQPHKILNPAWADYITKNMDWETEGKVGYEPRPSAPRPGAANIKAVAPSKEKKPAFQRIILLGERHSGTSYTTKMLAKCFPKLHVGDILGRYKHWFQPTPDYMVHASKTFLQDPDTPDGALTSTIQKQWPELVARDDPKAAFKNSLLIVMFRNPYDWLEAMREGPHHWPNHYDTIRIKKGVYEIERYGWNKFVSADMKFSGDNSADSPLCQFGYPAGSVSPCLASKELYPAIVKEDYVDNLNAAPDSLPYNAHRPIYEFDKNGKPFSHPLELRAAKIRDFLDIPNKWDLGGFIKLQHEEVNMKGAAFLLEQVSKIVGMKPECNPDPPMKQEGKELENDWSDWITKHTDWEAEKMVGYQPRVETNSRQKGL